MFAVDATLLHALPLPAASEATSKNDRGSVLVVGGTRETPGGVRLAGEAALRIGAGRIQLATVERVAAAMAVAVPEARVIALPEARNGAIAPDAAEVLRPRAEACDVLVVGPGAMDSDATGELLRALLAVTPPSTAVVIDAAAIAILHENPGLVANHAGDVLVVPNPTEMGRLLDRDEACVANDPQVALLDALDHLSVPVALRGGETWISAPGEPTFVDRAGVAALGTAGSGDVAIGILAGLLARGAAPIRAMLWGLHTHAVAGRMTAAVAPDAGLLARDLLDRIPAAFSAICEREEERVTR